MEETFTVIFALGSMIGVLYGAFEVYKDYMDMKEQIQSYVAPDLSGIEEQIAVQQKPSNLKTLQWNAMRTLIVSQETVIEHSKKL